KSPFVTSGIRIGVPAITTRGMKEEQMPAIVEFIDQVLMNIDNTAIVGSVKEKVKEFMQAFPLYPELKN
ncbi:MAG TPA: serine hydroxymethyltransferase, partial [Ferruginibacter sp.]|nr:serine hydroxymethyltransferase [Ferruginibacter sp.]